MLEILTRNLNPCSESQDLSPVVFPRRGHRSDHQPSSYVNAAPSSDQSVRRKRYARGLVLWATLLKMMSEYEARGYRASQHAVAGAAAPAFCIGSALPHTKTLALHSVSSHNEFL